MHHCLASRPIGANIALCVLLDFSSEQAQTVVNIFKTRGQDYKEKEHSLETNLKLNVLEVMSFLSTDCELTLSPLHYESKQPVLSSQ